MALRISPEWKEMIYQQIKGNQLIDETLSWNRAAQWLIELLAEKSISFKLYNLGAGVKRITTKTDICPCCKKRLRP